MAIAPDMAAAVHHGHLMPRLGQMPPDHSTRKPCANIENMHVAPLSFLRPWPFVSNIP
jgi:hypothetical protein